MARSAHPPADDWLLLAFQLPPQASSLRVKVWRRLQAIGAVPVSTSLYALPDRPACREDFEWLLRAVRAGEGEGVLIQGRLLAGVDAAALRARFEAAREAEYRELAEQLQAEAADAGRAVDDVEAASTRLARARRRLAEIEGRDFFGADGRAVVAGLLQALDRRRGDARARKARGGGVMKGKAKAKLAALRGKTWVTRERVHVDRIACAWLIRRRIDPEARFRFVAARDAAPKAGEIRFDMFEAEFTHDGDRCSFEVLLDHLGLDDPAFRALAEIVHDIDLKDDKFGRPETPGIAAVLQGICRARVDDPTRLARGAELFDDLYRRFGGKDRPA